MRGGGARQSMSRLSLCSAALLAVLLHTQSILAAGTAQGPESAGKPPAAKIRPAAEMVWQLLDEHGEPVRPVAAAQAGKSLFLLTPEQLYRLDSAGERLQEPQSLRLTACGPPAGSVGGIPIQELTAISFCPGRGSIVVLAKAGDLFEYLIDSGQWRVFRANMQLTGSPDPEYIDIASLATRICVLDPERNEIWRFPAARGSRSSYFAEVLPWRLKPGDINVSDGIAIAYDGDTYVLRRRGRVTRYGGGEGNGLAFYKPFPWRPLKAMRPSRLATGPGTPVFVVERENNRVIAIDKGNGRSRQFLFGRDSDLRGLVPGKDGFWIIDGDHLVRRNLAKPDPWSRPLNARRIDPRLDGLALPLSGVALPRHPGVWPGARRLYRYGVHQGVDFFGDAATTGSVTMGTPVHAADAGKVIRADVNFRDMDGALYNKVMRQCRLQHRTSAVNEDLLRGCQVWIDHGHGLLTRYAHLNAVKKGIKPGVYVSQGDVLGYVGVSGTGQNLPGVAKHPHLHFEIWLDGEYLGYGLTQAETLGVYEDIFGIAGERGG